MSPQSTPPVSPFARVHERLGEWLNLPWPVVASSLAKSADRGHFTRVARAIEAGLAEPPLLEWLEELSFAGRGSPMNWCLRCASTPAHKPEEKLERAIRGMCGARWFNQIPVASGFRGGNRKAIDLVCQVDDAATHFRVIELKAIPGTNNPLFAACELIQYALAYCWFRERLRLMKLPAGSETLLGAKRVDFEVLAPRDYYVLGRYSVASLVRLEHTLDRAFERLGRGIPAMSFRFLFVEFPVEAREQAKLLADKEAMNRFVSPRGLSDLPGANTESLALNGRGTDPGKQQSHPLV